MLRAMAIALALLPLAVAIFYVARYAVDVPYYDQWSQVPFLEQFFAGRLSFRSLFARHGGHIAFLPRVTTLLSLVASRWSMWVELWLGFAFMVGTGALVSTEILRDAEGPPATTRLLFVFAVTTVLFSLRQWENLLAPWSFGFFGAPFFVLLACFFAARSGARSFAIAFAAALTATVTFTNGLLVWWLVPLHRSIRRGRATARSRLVDLTWIIAGVGAWGSYILGATPMSAQRRARVGDALLRIPTGLGLALSPDKAVISGGALPLTVPAIDVGATALIGMFVAGVLAFSVYRLRRRGALAGAAIGLALALFGGASIVMAAAGRANLGVAQILSSRYTTPAALFAVGTFLLAERATRGDSSRPWLVAPLVTLFVVTSAVATLTELHVGPARKAFLATWAASVRGFRTVPDSGLANPHYSPAQIRDFCSVLERHRLSVFAGASPPEDDLVEAFPLFALEGTTTASVAAPGAVETLTAGERGVRAITIRSPARYRLDHVPVEPRDVLELDVAAPSEGASAARAYVEIVAGGNRTRLLEVDLSRPHGRPLRWRRATLPLSTFAGQVVSIVLGSEPPSGEPAGGKAAFGAVRLGAAH